LGDSELGKMGIGALGTIPAFPYPESPRPNIHIPGYPLFSVTDTGFVTVTDLDFALYNRLFTFQGRAFLKPAGEGDIPSYVQSIPLDP
jgi:hypothetical protein